MAFAAGLYAYGFGAIEEPAERGGPYRDEALAHLRTVLSEHAPSLTDVGSVVEDRAGPGLVHAAQGSELLVVGTRGWSPRADLSLGSVGAYCARHATVPVALIPPEVPPVHDELDVIVGFDGSQHSRAALRWTLGHVRHSAKVTAVRAFVSESVIGEPLSPSPDASETRARQELEADLADVMSHLRVHHPVEAMVMSGDPRAVLRDAAGDADLLVVGARGHGALDRLLLGSVANALVHHPTVRTIVVPHHHHLH